jgi:putative ABC transport system permease protein
MHDWKKDVERRLAGLGLDPAREAEIAEELAQHLEDRYEEARSAGATDEEAYRAALDEIADSGLLTRELRDVERRAVEPVAIGAEGKGNPLDDLWRDLRLALRDLRKRPAFTAIVVATIALGIGANTAIFSFVYAVLLNPLPFSEPDRLVFLAEKNRTHERWSVAYPNYVDWTARAQSFDDMAAFWSKAFTLTGIDEPAQLRGRHVNWNFFRVLGVRPQLGRLFVEEDDRPGAAPTLVLSNETWRDRFGSDPEIVGKTIRLDEELFTIIGVLPGGYELLRPGDIYVPLAPAIEEGKSLFLDRGNHFSLYGLARLKPGVSVGQADREMQGLAAQLEQEYSATNSGSSAGATSLAEVLVGDVRKELLVLLGAVGFVLLIACLNVANLLSVRAAGRQKEIAVRIALGAKRSRIVRQFLTESLLISLAGGTVGFLVAIWATRGLVALAPSGIPRLEQVGVNLPVLAFTLCVSVAIGLLFGLLPALQATRPDLSATLKEGGRLSAGRPHERTRRALLVSEVALALVLLIGAGLMLRTVGQLINVDPGFDVENLLTARFELPTTPYPGERRRAFYDECLTRVGALPGVQSAALTFSLPIDGSNWNSVFIVGDKPVPPSAELPSAAMTPVSTGFFDTMKIRLVKGRSFDARDGENAPKVVMINETLARQLWPGEEAIGKRFKQGWPESDAPWREVVGVVADVKTNGVDQVTPLQVYMPIGQETPRLLYLVVRTAADAGDPLALGTAVGTAVHAVDRDVPVYSVASMDELMAGAIENQRVVLTLLGGFAVLALVLAAIGIYGVMSYTVAQRTHEIGVRSALGARPSHVLRMVLGQGMALALAGVAIGLAGAFALTRLMEGLLFGVSATDPLTYVAISLLLAGVAVVACYVPARRATKVDPTVALRYE